MKTLYPLDFNNNAMDDAVIPLPNPETTPPVTNAYFVITLPPKNIFQL
jgi:hypothetical protein